MQRRRDIRCVSDCTASDKFPYFCYKHQTPQFASKLSSLTCRLALNHAFDSTSLIIYVFIITSNLLKLYLLFLFHSFHFSNIFSLFLFKLKLESVAVSYPRRTFAIMVFHSFRFLFNIFLFNPSLDLLNVKLRLSKTVATLIFVKVFFFVKFSRQFFFRCKKASLQKNSVSKRCGTNTALGLVFRVYFSDIKYLD